MIGFYYFLQLQGCSEFTDLIMLGVAGWETVVDKILSPALFCKPNEVGTDNCVFKG